MTVNKTTKRIIRITYFTMLAVILSMAKITLPSYPFVPYTLLCVVAVAAGLILGKKEGMLSQLFYLILGLVGLPIFVNGGGYLYVLDPSFGYILAFPFGAFLSGFLKSRFKTLSVIKLFFSAFFALGLIYLVGMIYQVIAVICFLDEGLLNALNSLIPIPFYFIVDAVILYLICLAYPKFLTVIGDNQPFVKSEQRNSQIKSDKNFNNNQKFN